MDKFRKLLDNELDSKLIKITLSGRKKVSASEHSDKKDFSASEHSADAKINAGVSKISVRPVEIKGSLLFQTSEYVNNKVIHHNRAKDEAIECLIRWMTKDFKQCQIETTENIITVLVSKKGKVTISKKKRPTALACGDISHNRSKNYLLPADRKVDFLVDLGVMTKEGKIVNSKYDKFRQINRFLEFINDILPELDKLDKNKEITIIDFGCGKSYLTFAMYYFLKILKGYNIRIIGLDLKEDVIEHCNGLAKKYGYDRLNFEKGDIADFTGTDHADMVVTLHACDTATDYALEKAVKWGAKVIMSVPCCQHEINAQIMNEELMPVLKYGILKERLSAIITDAIRAEILESNGYSTQILEFIDMEHTPKNLLIRAVKTGEKKAVGAENGKKGKEKKAAGYKKLIEDLNINPTLEDLLGK